MYFQLEPNSGVPLGVQITRQLRLAIAAGRITPGAALPAARDLAAELHVNFHTVRKAYGELEQEGLLCVKRGVGTYVADQVPQMEAHDVRALVRQHVERLVADLAGLHVSPRDMLRLLTEELTQCLARPEEE